MRSDAHGYGQGRGRGDALEKRMAAARPTSTGHELFELTLLGRP